MANGGPEYVFVSCKYNYNAHFRAASLVCWDACPVKSWWGSFVVRHRLLSSQVSSQCLLLCFNLFLCSKHVNTDITEGRFNHCRVNMKWHEIQSTLILQKNANNFNVNLPDSRSCFVCVMLSTTVYQSQTFTSTQFPLFFARYIFEYESIVTLRGLDVSVSGHFWILNYIFTAPLIYHIELHCGPAHPLKGKIQDP